MNPVSSQVPSIFSYGYNGDFHGVEGGADFVGWRRASEDEVVEGYVPITCAKRADNMIRWKSMLPPAGLSVAARGPASTRPAREGNISNCLSYPPCKGKNRLGTCLLSVKRVWTSPSLFPFCAYHLATNSTIGAQASYSLQPIPFSPSRRRGTGFGACCPGLTGRGPVRRNLVGQA